MQDLIQKKSFAIHREFHLEIPEPRKLRIIICSLKTRLVITKGQIRTSAFTFYDVINIIQAVTHFLHNKDRNHYFKETQAIVSFTFPPVPSPCLVATLRCPVHSQPGTFAASLHTVPCLISCKSHNTNYNDYAIDCNIIAAFRGR